MKKSQQSTGMRKPQQRSHRGRGKIVTLKECLFLKLPREIRDMIYRDLLLDEKDGIQPQYHGLMQNNNSRRLHSSILRTCRSVYEEAIAVLYSENLFHYKTRSDCVHAWRPLGIRISNSQFSRIQKIEIAISPIQCCLYERDILKMIAYVEGLRCHLKTLHLDFCLNDHEARSWEIRERPPVWQVSGSERIATAVSELPLELNLTISTSSMSRANVDRFAVLTQYISQAKGWKVAVNQQWGIKIGKSKGGHEERFELQTWEDAAASGYTEKEKLRYHRKWELRPLP